MTPEQRADEFLLSRESALTVCADLALYWREVYHSASKAMDDDEVTQPECATYLARTGREFLRAMQDGDREEAHANLLHMMGAALLFVDTYDENLRRRPASRRRTNLSVVRSTK